MSKDDRLIIPRVGDPGGLCTVGEVAWAMAANETLRFFVSDGCALGSTWCISWPELVSFSSRSVEDRHPQHFLMASQIRPAIFQEPKQILS